MLCESCCRIARRQAAQLVAGAIRDFGCGVSELRMIILLLSLRSTVKHGSETYRTSPLEVCLHRLYRDFPWQRRDSAFAGRSASNRNYGSITYIYRTGPRSKPLQEAAINSKTNFRVIYSQQAEAPIDGVDPSFEPADLLGLQQVST